MKKIQRIIPCLWFDNHAEEAAKFYTSIFKNSRIGSIARLIALNGGPVFKFNEAVSFEIGCKTRKKWTITGKGFMTAATRRRNSAAGSRTNTGFLAGCAHEADRHD